MSNFKDLTGMSIRNYKVLKDTGKRNPTKFLCICKCGVVKEISSTMLISGKTYSCKSCNKIIHGDSKEKLYKVWSHMRERCNCKTNKEYKNYGSRGITVCVEWNSYSEFKKWSMKNGYKEGFSIDRVNNDSGYEPENCRWATTSEQNNNKRTNWIVGSTGKTLIQYCSENDISYTNVIKRLFRKQYYFDLVPHEIYKRGINDEEQI